MTDQITAPATDGGAQPEAPINNEITAPSDTPERISQREAGRILNAARRAKQEQTQAGADPAAPAQSSPPPGDAAPPQEANGETPTAAPDPASLPPIEPPRSWSAEKKEAFRTLPRDQQEYITEHENRRDTELRRAQSEVADQRKAIDTERQAMTKARSEYEAALPKLLATLQNSSEFADINTPADIEKLVKEDWPRYVQWDFHQKKIAAVQQELVASRDRQTKEAQDEWAKFVAREDERFAEKAPEIKDPQKGQALRDAAGAVLAKLGFSIEELGKLWNGQDKLSLRDHRLQLLILDGVKYRQAQDAALKAVKKDVPPVQRPGVAAPGKDGDAKIKDLSDKVDRSSGINALRAAASLVSERRKAAR